VFSGIDPVRAVVIVIALVACVTDLRAKRIPNVLTFGGALAGIAFHAVTGGFTGVGHSAGGWVVGVLAYILPFVLGGLGAGDVKLIAALGAWLGPVDTLWLALYTGIAGGISAVIVAVAHGYLRSAVTNISVLLIHWRVQGVRPLHEVSLAGSAGPRLAYAVPILGGLLATIWLQQ
jgi:prepilin peptidase CpaA